MPTKAATTATKTKSTVSLARANLLLQATFALHDTREEPETCYPSAPARLSVTEAWTSWTGRWPGLRIQNPIDRRFPGGACVKMEFYETAVRVRLSSSRLHALSRMLEG